MSAAEFAPFETIPMKEGINPHRRPYKMRHPKESGGLRGRGPPDEIYSSFHESGEISELRSEDTIQQYYLLENFTTGRTKSQCTHVFISLSSFHR